MNIYFNKSDYSVVRADKCPGSEFVLVPNNLAVVQAEDNDGWISYLVVDNDGGNRYYEYRFDPRNDFEYFMAFKDQFASLFCGLE